MFSEEILHCTGDDSGREYGGLMKYRLGNTDG